MRTCETHHHACDCRERLFARALEIADEAMTERLRDHAKQADEHGVMLALCDADSCDVATLAEADTPAIEAVEWLTQRGLCELVESPHGATVVLLSARYDGQRRNNRQAESVAFGLSALIDWLGAGG